jgi:hypothetical protein
MRNDSSRSFRHRPGDGGSRLRKLRRACDQSLSKYIILGRDIAVGVVGLRLLCPFPAAEKREPQMVL